jgi:hypothetical protein
LRSPCWWSRAGSWRAWRNRRFFSLAELNQAIAELVADLNTRPMRRLGVSRRDLFLELDRPALKELPAEPYQYAEWRVRRVVPVGAIDPDLWVVGHSAAPARHHEGHCPNMRADPIRQSLGRFGIGVIGRAHHRDEDLRWPDLHVSLFERIYWRKAIYLADIPRPQAVGRDFPSHRGAGARKFNGNRSRPILTDIPRIPGLLSAIFRLIEARRDDIRPQPASFAANCSGCSPRGSGTRAFAFI